MNLFRLLFIDDLPKDGIEKVNNDIINITEAVVISEFESEDARNQILDELRQYDRMYRMGIANEIGKEFKKQLIDIMMKKAMQSREAGLGECLITKEDINGLMLKTKFHIGHIGNIKAEGEPCQAYKKIIEKEYDVMIKRWKKSVLEKVKKHMSWT